MQKLTDNLSTSKNTVKVNGVEIAHDDLLLVIEDFYARIQRDTVLQKPFESVEDWPEHIQKLTHFWWVRFGGEPYLFNHYDPVAKHFFAGFNRDLLKRWLITFHETLQTHLTAEQTAVWGLVSERMGEALSMKNDLFKRQYESRNEPEVGERVNVPSK